MRRLPIFGLLICSAWAFSQNPAAANTGVIGEVRSPDATIRGAVQVGTNGTSVMSGSQVTAGASNAAIGLKRGGDLELCKESNVTLTSASSGREILIALNSGTFELQYSLPSTSDTIITPDFRVTLTGPGAFHFAVGTSANGGMCVRSLPGNTSSLIVNEQFGDGAHQVKPGEQIEFHNGKVDNSTPDAATCGCPQTAPLASAPAVPTNPALAFPEQQSRQAEQVVAAGGEPPKSAGIPVAPSQAAKPGQTYTQIDAPMVFRAEDVPRPIPSLATVKMPPAPPIPAFTALPPATSEKKPWYQRWGSAIGSLFGRKSARKEP